MKAIDHCYCFKDNAVFMKSSQDLMIQMIPSDKYDVSDLFIYDDELSKKLKNKLLKLNKSKLAVQSKNKFKHGIHQRSKNIHKGKQYSTHDNEPLITNKPPMLPKRSPILTGQRFFDSPAVVDGYDQVLNSVPTNSVSKGSKLASFEELRRDKIGSIRPLPPTPRLNRKSLSAGWVAENEGRIRTFSSDPSPLQIFHENGVKARAVRDAFAAKNAENEYESLDSELEQNDRKNTSLISSKQTQAKDRAQISCHYDKNAQYSLKNNIENDYKMFNMTPSESKISEKADHFKLSSTEKIHGRVMNLNATDKAMQSNLYISKHQDELDGLVIWDDQLFSDEDGDDSCIAIPALPANSNDSDLSKNAKSVEENNNDNTNCNSNGSILTQIYLVNKASKARSKSEEFLRKSDFSQTLSTYKVCSKENFNSKNRLNKVETSKSSPKNIIRQQNELKYEDDSNDVDEASDVNIDDDYNVTLNVKSTSADEESASDNKTEDTWFRNYCINKNQNSSLYEFVEDDIIAYDKGQHKLSNKIESFFNRFQLSNDCMIMRKKELVVPYNEQVHLMEPGNIMLRSKTGNLFLVPFSLVTLHMDESSNYFLFPYSLSERQATYFLETEKHNGVFLIYPALQNYDEYRLSLRYNEAVIHYKIKYKDEGYFFIKGSRRRFYCLVDMVEYYRLNRDDLATRLTKSLKDNRKSNQSIFRTHLDLLISRNTIHFDGIILGQGQFGMICLGKCNGKPVAIKTYQARHNNYEIEFKILAELKHLNIIELFGFNNKILPYYMVLEYCDNGNLQDYKLCNDLTIDQIKSFLFQMTASLSYLAQCRFIIHRDVRLRNFFVSNKNNLKLGDFSKATRVMEDEFNAEHEEIIIKYAAVEVLHSHVYSTKSDVWSFAISAWELFSKEPAFSRLTLEETLFHVVDGGRLLKPETCPDDIFNLLKKCWHINTGIRPSAEQIHNKLRTKLLQYDLNMPLKKNVIDDNTDNTCSVINDAGKEDLTSTRNKIKETLKRLSLTKKDTEKEDRLTTAQRPGSVIKREKRLDRNQ